MSWGVRPAVLASRSQAFIAFKKRACASGSVRGSVPTMKVPCPGPGLHQPLAFEVAVGLQHRVRVDRQLCDDLLRGRQLVTGFKEAELERLMDLLDEL
jgi:hypothetical protein